MEITSDAIWNFVRDDTYLTTNIIIAVGSLILYLLCLLLWKLTDCCKTFAGRVVIDAKSESKYDVARSENPALSDEAIVYRYLYKTYWKKCKHHPRPSKTSEIFETDFKPVLRIYDHDRNIHIIYSRKTVWKLAFSEKLESGRNEKFGFVFKGLKSWSAEETQGRFANVMQDLFELRQVIMPHISIQFDLFISKIQLYNLILSRLYTNKTLS